MNKMNLWTSFHSWINKKSTFMTPEDIHEHEDSKVFSHQKDSKLIWFFLKPYKVHFMVLATLAILVGILETLNVAVLYPILSCSILDTQAGANSNLFFKVINIFTNLIPINDVLIKYCVLFIVLACLTFVIRMMYVILSVRITSKIGMANKEAVFNKSINSDYRFFIDNKQGDILFNVSNAPGHITTLLSLLTNTLVELILSLSLLIMLFSLSLIGGILVIIVGMGYYYVTKHLSVKVSLIAGSRQYEAGRSEHVVINECINGIKPIRIFNAASYWKKMFDKALNTYWNYYRKDHIWIQVPSLVLSLLIFVSIVGVVISIKLYNPHEFVLIIPVVRSILRILPMLPYT